MDLKKRGYYLANEKYLLAYKRELKINDRFDLKDYYAQTRPTTAFITFENDDCMVAAKYISLYKRKQWTLLQG